MFLRRALTFAACLLALGLAGVSIVDGEGFRRYLRLRGEVQALEGKNADLRSQNAVLAREVEALRSNPAALERAAREELGFIAPGEVVVNLEP